MMIDGDIRATVSASRPGQGRQEKVGWSRNGLEGIAVPARHRLLARRRQRPLGGWAATRCGAEFRVPGTVSLCAMQWYRRERQGTGDPWLWLRGGGSGANLWHSRLRIAFGIRPSEERFVALTPRLGTTVGLRVTPRRLWLANNGAGCNRFPSRQALASHPSPWTSTHLVAGSSGRYPATL